MVTGIVQNGEVKLQGPLPFAEGTTVSIVAISIGTSSDEAEPLTTIGKRLAALGRRLEAMPCDLPNDLAVNHDHYLHGAPKRQ